MVSGAVDSTASPELSVSEIGHVLGETRKWTFRKEEYLGLGRQVRATGGGSY
jgi:hypothetical protein